MPWASSWWSSQSFWAVHCPKTNFNPLSDEAGKKLLLTTRLQFSYRHSCSRCSFIKCDCGVPKDHSWESLYCTPFPWVNTCFFAPPAHLGRRIFPPFLSTSAFSSIYFCVFLLMPLLPLSPEVLGNGLSRRQALGQEMFYSHYVKTCDFKKEFSSGEIGRIRAQAQTGRIGWMCPTFSWSVGYYLLHQDPLGILLKGMAAVKRI